MNVLIIFIILLCGIAIGATVVVLINNRRKHMKKKHPGDEEAQLSIEEQYDQMYGDK